MASLVTTWRRLRLNVKMIVAIMFILGMVTILSGWILIVNEQQVLLKQVEAHSASLAKAAAVFALEPLLVLDYPVLRTYAEKLIHEKPDLGFIRFKRADGKVASEASKLSVSASSVELRIHSAEIHMNGGSRPPIGWVEIGMLTHRSDQLVTSRIRFLSLAFFLLFVILALSLTLLLKKLVTDPVHRISRQAHALGEGDMETEIALLSRDELGLLADVLDVMRRKLKNSILEVADQNQQLMGLSRTLEQRVTERTKTLSRLNVRMEEEIQERKQTAEALRNSEEKYRAIIKNAEVGIALADLQGRFLEVNPTLAAMLGYAADDLIRMSWMDITYPEDLTLNKSLHEDLIAGRRDAYHMEKRYLSKTRL